MVCGPGEPRDLVVAADGQHFAVCNSNGLHGARLVFCKSFAGVDDAVEVDQVRNRGGRGFRRPLCSVPWSGSLSRAKSHGGKRSKQQGGC